MKAMTKTNRVPSLLESFFDDFDRAFTTTNGRNYSPAIEVTRSEDAYKVRAVLPGVAREDLNVKVENGYLHISGKSSWKKEENHKDVYSEIHRYEHFERSLRLDEQNFDVEQVGAKLENGVLEITLPIKEAAKPKQIEIRVD